MDRKLKAAIKVLEMIELAGFEAYFVGGCVRDLILKRANKDIDIATSATPDEVKFMFKNTVNTGLKHGTVLIKYEGGVYDVTTFRSDGKYVDYRRPKSVSFVKTLRTDLERRDFTMNAIALNRLGEYIDYFDGISDIKEGVIRGVGDVEKRFNEDALRILRAIRFQSQLNFHIEEKTFAALKKYAANLSHIAQERITAEFELLLMGKGVNKALKSLIFLNITQYLPQLTNLRSFTVSVNLTLNEKWCVLILQEKLCPEQFLREWKCSKKCIYDVKKLVAAVNKIEKFGWTRVILFDLGSKSAHSVQKILQQRNSPFKDVDVETLYSELPIYNQAQLQVSASDLRQWNGGKKAGKWIGMTLRSMIEGVINNEVENNKEVLKKWWHKRN